MNTRLEYTTEFLRNVRQANNESAKKELLKTLLVRLFDKDAKARKTIDTMSLGAERVVFQIPLRERIKTGFADTQYGNVIIEFENNLNKTGEHAKEQLCEYLAGNWKSGSDYSYMLIATDGVGWIVYAPGYESLINRSDFKAEDIKLTEVESFTITEKNADGFYFFLDRYLFRTERQTPTLERIKQDFGETSPTFLSCIDALANHFQEVKNQGEVQTAFEQWKRFLSIAYGVFEGREDIFLVHTYLSIFAKILAYEVLTHDDFIDEKELQGIIHGDIFDRLHIKNFIGNDFYNWVAGEAHFKPLKRVFRKITRQIGDYDFTSVEEDILKGVYQDLINLDTRHALGEYYTPDWLCKRIVEDLDLERDSRMLDPACGSGSFLRAAIAKLKAQYPDLSADEISRRVVGIDIHPLSVQIAKTTLLLALGNKIKAERRPVTLRVYLANTLLAPEGSVGLFGADFNMTIDRGLYKISSKVFDDPGLFDIATTACEELAGFTLNGPDADIETFRNTLGKRGVNGLDENLTQSFYRIYRGLKRAKQEGRDSIWRFIIQNIYKPYFLRDKFDFVIGNPPWLTYKDVEDGEYQNRLRELATKYRVMPRKKANFTHLEIAAIFLAHSASYFLKQKGRIAFVLPRSFFSADHHDNTRAGLAEGFKITALWDLDKVAPLFRVPSCVLFGKRAHAAKKIPKSGVPGLVVSGKLKSANPTWAEAEPTLTFKKTTFYYGRLGKLSAFTRRKTTASGKVNVYKNAFKQGATLVPRNFYFVELTQDPPPDYKDRILTVRTGEEQRKLAKPPWKALTLEGRVNSNFLFRTALSKNIVPFALIEPELVLLPVKIGGDKAIHLLDWEQLQQEGDLESATWFRQGETYWEAHKTERSKNMSYLDRLDYQRGLADQNLNREYLVLYTSSAKDANAVVFQRRMLDLPFIVDHKAYWFGTNHVDEAHFVAGFLNSGVPNLIIKDYQSRGLFGARDVHKKILEVPFPRFDPKDGLHQQLASLSKEATEKAASFLSIADLSDISTHRLGNLRLAVKEHLTEEFREMDRIVEKITETV